LIVKVARDARTLFFERFLLAQHCQLPLQVLRGDVMHGAND